MLVMRRVLLALFCARAARCQTGDHDRSQNFGALCGLPQDDALRRVAQIGAVEREPHDCTHLLDVGFTEARVGARIAARGALAARFRASQQHVVRQGGGLRMEREDLTELSGHLWCVPPRR